MKERDAMQGIKVKRILLGFALLLFANLFVVPEAILFYVGLGIGIIGLYLVVSSFEAEK